jgi:hypothetical protein
MTKQVTVRYHRRPQFLVRRGLHMFLIAASQRTVHAFAIRARTHLPVRSRDVPERIEQERWI